MSVDNDQLPTASELPEELVINPNTMAHTYRELFAWTFDG
jgi:DNA-binding transcriptional regulator YhcF (GntR family)